MHQRDFILRIIEQIGAAFVELRRRILRQEEGSASLQDSLARTASQAGFDIDLLRGFDLSALVLLTAPAGDVDPTRCWLMAEILYLDGLEANLSAGDGRDSLLKARALYDLVRPSGGMLIGMPEAAERISEIDRLLEEPGGLHPGSGTGRPRRVSTRTRAPSLV